MKIVAFLRGVAIVFLFPVLIFIGMCVVLSGALGAVFGSLEK